MYVIKLEMNVALMILAYLGLTHEDVVAMGWPRSAEFHCWNWFDVKLSYSPYDVAYYLKSYPSDPHGNMLNLLLMIKQYCYEHRYGKRCIENIKGKLVEVPFPVMDWNERDKFEHDWYMAHTGKHGEWLDNREELKRVLGY